MASQLRLLPPETAWLVPLLTIGLVFAVLATLVVVGLPRRFADPDEDTAELRSRVESPDEEVESLRESRANDRSPPSPGDEESETGAD